MELNDLKYRFYQSPVEKIFAKIRSSAFPRIETSDEIAKELKRYLDLAGKYCDFSWDLDGPALYRARKNDYDQFKEFPPSEMGAPDANLASDGRAQPAGVSLLYVADTVPTAIAEVRPEIGEYVTIGEFRIKSGYRLKVLDLTRFHAPNNCDKDIFCLIDLSRRAFSGSVHPKDPKKYYAHQYFVQMVRDLSYDGIGYESAVNQGGRCFAFFDAKGFECEKTLLYQVNSVSVISTKVEFSSIEKEYLAQQDAEIQRNK